MIRVLVTGCFDGFHKGHQYLINRVSSILKDKHPYEIIQVIIAVNDDQYVLRVKHNNPVNSLFKRMFAIKSFCQWIYKADFSIISFTGDSLSLIKAIEPNYLFCGSDYTPETIIGYDHIKSYGGEVIIVDRLKGYSSSGVL